jgi:hypothetical protein
MESNGRTTSKADNGYSLSDKEIDEDKLQELIKLFREVHLPKILLFGTNNTWMFYDLDPETKKLIYGIGFENFFKHLPDELLISFKPYNVGNQVESWNSELEKRELKLSALDFEHAILARAVEVRLTLAGVSGEWSFSSFEGGSTVYLPKVTDFRIFARHLSTERLHTYRAAKKRINIAFSDELQARIGQSKDETEEQKLISEIARELAEIFGGKARWSIADLKKGKIEKYRQIINNVDINALLEVLPTELLITLRQYRRKENILVISELFKRFYPGIKLSEEEIDRLLSLRELTEIVAVVDPEIREANVKWNPRILKSSDKAEFDSNTYNMYSLMCLDSLRLLSNESKRQGRGVTVNDEIAFREANPDYHEDLIATIKLIYSDPKRLAIEVMRLRVRTTYWKRIIGFIPNPIAATFDQPNFSTFTNDELIEYSTYYIEALVRQNGAWDFADFPNYLFDFFLGGENEQKLMARMDPAVRLKMHEEFEEMPKKFGARCEEMSQGPCIHIGCRMNVLNGDTKFEKQLSTMGDGPLEMADVINRVLSGVSNCAFYFADFGGMQYGEIGDIIGVSGERVRQIEAIGNRKLRHAKRVGILQRYYDENEKV